MKIPPVLSGIPVEGTSDYSLYYSLVQHLPKMAVMVFDRDFRYLLADGELLYQFGFTREQLIGKTIWDVFSKSSAESLLRYYESPFRDEKVSFEQEYTGVICLTQAVPIKDASGHIYAGMFISRDISETRRKQIEQRKLAESHYAFSQSLIANFDSDEAFERLLTILLDTFSCDVADLSCLDKPDHLRIMHIQGYDLTPAEDQYYTEGFQVTDDYILQQVVYTGQPFLLGDIRETPSCNLILAADNRSFLAVPVQLDNNMIGVLRLSANAPYHFSEDHTQQLMYFAAQVSLTIKNRRLHRQLQNNAVSQERQRLARELHDSVTQTLFSASMVAQSLPHLWKYGEAEVKQAVVDLGRLAQGALAEMRTLLVELRPEAIEGGDLAELLKYLLDALAGQRQLSIDLQCSGNTKLPPDVQVSFYRIAQEALNNILKHSQATTVRARLILKVDQAELHIVDNGQGFDMNAIPANHFGLSNSAERAREAGASLTIESAIGKGTQLSLIWNAPVTTNPMAKALRK